jgi:hypothetical protein
LPAREAEVDEEKQADHTRQKEHMRHVKAQKRGGTDERAAL